MGVREDHAARKRCRGDRRRLLHRAGARSRSQDRVVPRGNEADVGSTAGLSARAQSPSPPPRLRRRRSAEHSPEDSQQRQRRASRVFPVGARCTDQAHRAGARDACSRQDAASPARCFPPQTRRPFQGNRMKHSSARRPDYMNVFAQTTVTRELLGGWATTNLGWRAAQDDLRRAVEVHRHRRQLRRRQGRSRPPVGRESGGAHHADAPRRLQLRVPGGLLRFQASELARRAARCGATR